MKLYPKILVTTDFSDQALAAVREAARVARECESEVVLVHVIEDRVPPLLDPKTWAEVMKTHREQAKISLARYAEEHLSGCRVGTEIGVGIPHRGVIDAAERHEVDLIVIASQGHSRLGHALLGSTVDRVLRAAPCPVLVVRPDEE